MSKHRTKLNLEIGWAEWDSFDMTRVGDRVIPSVIEVTAPGGPELQPALKMQIRVVDGIPVCSRVEVTMREGGRGVQAQDMRAVRLQDWTEEIVAAASMLYQGTAKDGSHMMIVGQGPEWAADARKAVRAMQRGGRRKIDTKLLAQVADLYRQHEDSGKPVEAVQSAYGTSYRSAARWVQRAREEGLL